MTIRSVSNPIPNISEGPPAKRARLEEGSSAVRIWNRSSSSSANVLDRIIPSRFAMQQAQSSEGCTLKRPKTFYQRALMRAIVPNYNPDRVLLHKSAKPFQITPNPAPVWSIPDRSYCDFNGGDSPFTNDYYAHPLDWGLSINYAVGHQVHSIGRLDAISELVSFPDSTIIYSIKSSPNLNEVAIGDEEGTLSLFDIGAKRISLSEKVALMYRSKIFCIGWRKEGPELTMGLRSSVVHIDKRQKGEAWALSLESNQQTCSVDWNKSNFLVATGNNANQLRVFDVRNLQEENPIYKFESEAAMKALQWNPDDPDVLIAGAGSSDKHLYVVDLKEGKVVCKENVGSQVCDLTWLDAEHVVIGAGFSAFSEVLSVWRYGKPTQSLQKIKGMTGPNGRVLNVVKDWKSPRICAHSSNQRSGQQALHFWKPEKIEEAERRERRTAKGLMQNQLGVR